MRLRSKKHRVNSSPASVGEVPHEPSPTLRHSDSPSPTVRPYKSFEEHKWILDRIGDTQRAADQKAAILLGFFGVAIGAVLSGDLLPRFFDLPSSSQKIFGFFLGGMTLVGAAITLVAAASVLLGRTNSSPEGSVIYFGDIAKTEIAEIENSLASPIPARDIANQIKINSTICAKKYQFFRYSLVSALTSTLIGVTALIVLSLAPTTLSNL